MATAAATNLTTTAIAILSSSAGNISGSSSSILPLLLVVVGGGETFPETEFPECQSDYYLFDQRCHTAQTLEPHTYGISTGSKQFLKFDQDELNIINLCMIVSSISLLMSLLVYLVVTELRTLPGKCLMGLIFSELATNCCIMVMVRLNKNESYGRERTWLCLVVGVAGHYFFLTIMSWSNVIALDLLRKIHNPTRKLHNFIPYIYFAYLTPLFVILLTIGLDFAISDQSPWCALRPQYGLRMCGLSTNLSKLVFATVPLSLSLMLSFVVLLVAIYHLRRLIAELSLSKIPKSVSLRFSLYGKLFILLGIFFLFGFMGVLMSCSHALNFVSLIISSFHGTCIFVVFTCKRSVLKLLVKHFRRWRHPANSVDNGNGPRSVRSNGGGSSSKSNSLVGSSSLNLRHHNQLINRSSLSSPLPPPLQTLQVPTATTLDQLV